MLTTNHFLFRKLWLVLLAILVGFTLFSPTSAMNAIQWRFISGSSLIDQLGKCGAAGAFSQGYYPGGRRGGAMMRSDVAVPAPGVGGDIFLFGGEGYPVVGTQGYLGDMWVHRQPSYVSKGTWAWAGGPANFRDNANLAGIYTGEPVNLNPGGRSQHTMWFHAGALYIHAGYGYAGDGPVASLSDLWTYTIATREFKWEKGESVGATVGTIGDKGVENANNIPPAGQEYSMLTKKTTGTAFLFGGNTMRGVVQMTWMYNKATNNWAWVSGTSGSDVNSVGGERGVYDVSFSPGARYSAQIVDKYTDSGGIVYLFGGSGRSATANGALADLWGFKVDGLSWAFIGGDSVNVNKLGTYSSHTFTASNTPGCRYRAAGFADPTDALIHVFSGMGYDSTGTLGILSDFWTWNLTSSMFAWTGGSSVTNAPGALVDDWFSPANNPGARDLAMVSKSNNVSPHELFVVGGQGNGANGGQGRLNDVWVTTGPAMAVVPSATATPPLNPMAWRWLTGSSSTNQNGVCGLKNQYSSTYTPGGRQFATMTEFASLDNTAYLFGGQGYATSGTSAGRLGDIWGYRQSSWSGLGEWAWLGGKSDTVNNVGVYTIVAENMPGARSQCGSWIVPGAPSKVLVFAGQGYDHDSDGSLNDLWSFDTISMKWEWLKGSSDKDIDNVAVPGTQGMCQSDNYPGTMFSYLLLSSSNEFIFGGWGYWTTSSTAGALADVWKWNSTSNCWTWMNGPNSINTNSIGGASGVFNSGYRPGARYSGAAMHSSNSNIAYLFGGDGYSSTGTSSGGLNDLWAYDLILNQWTFIAGDSVNLYPKASFGTLGFFGVSNLPGSRKFTRGWVDPNSELLISIFSGMGYTEEATSGTLNDHWSFNTSTKLWAWTGGDSLIDQSSTYAGAAGTWFSTGNKPGRRYGHSSSVNHDLGLIYLMGGYVGAAYTNELWSTKGPTVVIGISPSPSPTPTTVPVPTPTPLKPIAWRWLTGSSSTNQNGVCGLKNQYSSTYTPGSRIGFSMTTFSNTSTTFLIGGSGYHTAGFADRLGDMWAYSQSSWSGIGEWAWLGGKSDAGNYPGSYNAPTPQPGPRVGYSSWFMNNKVFVFGGNGCAEDTTYGELNDLWSFDISSLQWTWLKGSSLKDVGLGPTPTIGQCSASYNPPGLHGTRLLAQKPDRGLIFGGYGYFNAKSQYVPDIWSYVAAANCWIWTKGPSSPETTNSNSIGGATGVFSESFNPSSRVYVTSIHCSNSNSNIAYVFGGYGYSSVGTTVGYLADLWTYDLSINQWAYIVGDSANLNSKASFGTLGFFGDLTSSHPGSRQQSGGWSDPNSEHLISIFGGYGYTEEATVERMNDHWSFNFTNRQWAWTGGESLIDQSGTYAGAAGTWFSTGNKPGKRYSHSTSVNHALGLMYIFGGSPYPSSYINELWSTKGPTVVIGISPSPSPTPTTVPVPTPTPLKPIAWRWLTGSSVLNRNGVCGTAGQYSSAYSAGGRYRATMTAFSSPDNTAYLFGGQGYTTSTGIGSLGDIWAYRQSAWNNVGEWAWLGGKSDAINYVGVYTGTKRPGARSQSVSWIVSSIPSKVFVFGGNGYDASSAGDLNDVWSFDTASFVWEWLKGSSDKDSAAIPGSKGVCDSGNNPGSMRASVLLSSSHSQQLIFGGSGYWNVQGFLAHVWNYNSTSNCWTWMNGPNERNSVSVGGASAVFDPTNRPGARNSGASMHSPNSNVAYIFGGVGYSNVGPSTGSLADLWAYDMTINQWAYVAGDSVNYAASSKASFGTLGHFGASSHPGSRSMTAGWSDPNSESLISIFGGNGYTEEASVGYLNDYWSFNVSTKLWAWTGGDSLRNQAGTYSGAVGTWFSTGNKPGKIIDYSASLSYDYGLMVLFGGYNGAGYINELWSNKGPTVVIAATASPSATTTTTPTTVPVPTPTPLKPIAWRWLTGSSSTNQNGVCGLKNQYSSTYTPGSRMSATMTEFTSPDNTAYVFGGYGYANMGSVGFLGDMWAYRQSSWSTVGEWAWVGGKSDSIDYMGVYTGTKYPGSRRQHVSWIVSGNPNKVFVFGGDGLDHDSTTNYLNDLWSFDASSLEWDWLKGSSDKDVDMNVVHGAQGVCSASNHPGGMHGSMLLSNSHQLIFGGAGYWSSLGRLADVWLYNSTSNCWAWMNGPNSINTNSIGGASGVFNSAYRPGARYWGAAMHSPNSRGYVFGGMGYPSIGSATGYLADLWAYDLTMNQWAYIAGESVNSNSKASFGTLGFFGDSTSNYPGSRYHTGGWSDPNSEHLISIFGGTGFTEEATSGTLNDYWCLNTSTKLWAWTGGDSLIDQSGTYAGATGTWFSTGNKPGRRYGYSSSVNHDLGLIYLMGGSSLSGTNTLLTTKGPTVVIGISPSPSPTPTTPLKPIAWRWLTGTTLNNQNGVCGLKNQYSSTYTPGSRFGSMTDFASSSNTAYLFGGQGYATTGTLGYLGDMWAYRQTMWGSVGEWAWLGGKSDTINNLGVYVNNTGTAILPGARRYHVLWISQNKVFIFGGYGYDRDSGATYMSDLWSFDTSSLTWDWLKGTSETQNDNDAVPGTRGVCEPGNHPGGVMDHMLLSDTHGLIFGGKGYWTSSSFGYLADVWRYNLTSNCWTWMNGPNSINTNGVGGTSGVFNSAYRPGARWSSVTMHSPNSIMSYLFGGSGHTTAGTTGGKMADLWAYALNTNQWAYIAGESVNSNSKASFGTLGFFGESHQPGSRYSSGGWSDPNSEHLISIYAGLGFDTSTSGNLNDYWSFNTSIKHWAWTGGDSMAYRPATYSDGSWFSTGNKPGQMYGHATFAYSDLGLMYLFGGYEGSGKTNELWTTKGPTVVITATASPTPTPTPTTVPVPTPTPLKPIAWRWLTGSSATNQNGVCGLKNQYSSTYSPGSRQFATMTEFASTDNTAYLFGGQGYATSGTSAGRLGDVWAYRQSSWSGEGEWAWVGGKSDSLDYIGNYTVGGQYPGARHKHISWIVPGNPNKVFVFGGYGYDHDSLAVYLNDVWSFDTASFVWEWVKGSSDKDIDKYAILGTLGVCNSANQPGGSYGRVLLSNSQQLIFGGVGYSTTSSGNLANVWRFFSTSNCWTLVNGPNSANSVTVGGASGVFDSTYRPGARQFSTTMHSPNSNITYLFGGYGYAATGVVGHLGDLWAYALNINQWAYIAGGSVAANPKASYGTLSFFGESYHPGGRRYSGGWSDPNSEHLISIFGGDGWTEQVSTGYLNDYWTFNVTIKQWAWTGGNSLWPAVGAYDGAAGTWFSTANTPGKRFLHLTSVNHDLGLMFMAMGTVSGSIYTNELWTTKGPTVEIGISPSPSPSPSPTTTPTTVPVPTATPSLYPIAWRWLTGSSTTNQYSVCGTVGHYSSTHTPGSRGYAAMTDFSNSEAFLFGGKGRLASGYSDYLGDMWGYRQTSWSGVGEWAWLGGKSNEGAYFGNYTGMINKYPGGRRFVAAWTVPPNKVFIFGGNGYDFDSGGYLNDLWSFDTNSFTWDWLKGSSDKDVDYLAIPGTQGICNSVNHPGKMIGHRLLSNSHQLIFGGNGYWNSPMGNFAQIWKYNSTSNCWTWMHGPNGVDTNSVGGASGVFNSAYIPGARQFSTTMHSPNSNIAYVFGGNGQSSTGTISGLLADLWAYDISANQWSYIAGDSVNRNADALASFGTLGHFGTSNHPGSRKESGGWSDPNSEHLISIFGGQGYTEETTLGTLNDHWSFNTSAKQWAWTGGDSLRNQAGAYAGAAGTWFSTGNKPRKIYSQSTSVNHELGLMFNFGGITEVAYLLNELFTTKGPTVVIGSSPTPTTTPTASPTTEPLPTPTIVSTPSPTPLNPMAWRWLTGTSSTDQNSICGPKSQYASSYRPGGRSGAGMTLFSNSTSYLFGGTGHHSAGLSDYLGDMWAYRQSSWSDVGEWAWLGGNSDQGSYNGTYTGAPGALMPGARTQMVTWISMTQTKVFVFGGSGYDHDSWASYLNDLWSFDTNSLNWQWLKGSSDKDVANLAVPGTQGVCGADNHPGAIYAPMLLSNSHEFIFGGLGYWTFTPGYLSDIWKYTSTTNCWTWINGPNAVNLNGAGGASGVFNSGYRPGGRWGGVVMPSRISDLVYVFGGFGLTTNLAGMGLLGDIWAYDLSLNQWAYISGESVNANSKASFGTLGFFGDSTSNYPGSRYHTGGWSDPNSEHLISIFGGSGYTEETTIGALNDYWSFNTSTKQWAWAGGSSLINQNGTVVGAVGGWFSTGNMPNSQQGHNTISNIDLGLMFLHTSGVYSGLWATKGPTVVVEGGPTVEPTASPTSTVLPTASPTSAVLPTVTPTVEPTASPTSTVLPTASPTSAVLPTVTPTVEPTASPTSTVLPTASPTSAVLPTVTPTVKPTASPTTTTSPTTSPVTSPIPTTIAMPPPLKPVAWRWLSGESGINLVGVFGKLREFSSSFRPSSRASSSMIVSKDGQNMFLFGGDSAAGLMNDAWIYKINYGVGKGSWAWIAGQTTINTVGEYTAPIRYPGSRAGHCMWIDTNNDDKLWIFGGRGYASTNVVGNLNDMWVLSVSSAVFSRMRGTSTVDPNATYGTKGIPDTDNDPRGLRDFALLKADSGAVVITHGNGGGYNSATWLYVPAMNYWTWMAGSSLINRFSVVGASGVFSPAYFPGARMNMATMSPNNDLGYVFGGAGYNAVGSGWLQDLWALDLQTYQWAFIEGNSASGTEWTNYGSSPMGTWSNAHPGGRTTPLGWLDPNSDLLITYGGEGRAASAITGYLSDVFAFNRTLMKWSWVGGSSTISTGATFPASVGSWYSDSYQPGSRKSSIAATYSSANDMAQMYLFGGLGSGKLSDLWATRGPAVDILPSPTAVPPTPTAVPIFIEHVPEPEWRWLSGASTANSHQVPSPPAHPGAMSGGIMWTVPRLSEVYVFGGYGFDAAGAKTYLGDLWRYSIGLSVWEIVKASSTYGVYGGEGNNLRPGARNAAISWQKTVTSVAHDDIHLCLFGGFGYSATTSSSHLNDVWCYSINTGNWAWLKGHSIKDMPGQYPSIPGIFTDTTMPGARSVSSLLYTELDGSPVIFGGHGLDSSTNKGYLADLWRYSNMLNTWTWLGVSGSSIKNTKNNKGPVGEFGDYNTYSPGARWGAATSTMLDGKKYAWLYGGNGYETATAGVLSDTWAYDSFNGGWAFITGSTKNYATPVYSEKGEFTSSAFPGGRNTAHGFIDANSDRGLFYVFSGYSLTNYYADFWAFNTSAFRWSWIGGTSLVNQMGTYESKWFSKNNNPSARSDSGFSVASSLDGKSTVVQMFGGYGYSGVSEAVGYLNDLFETRGPFVHVPIPTPTSTPTPSPTPLPPVLVSFRFETPPLSIEAKFSEDTNMGGSFGAAQLASEYFVSASATKVGADSLVVWTSQSSMRILFFQGTSTVAPGDVLELKSDVIKALVSPDTRVYVRTAKVSPPDWSAMGDSAKPDPRIDAPTDCSGCDGLTMWGRIENGLFGRDPSSIVWSLVDSSASTQSQQNVSSTLAVQNVDQRLVVDIPAAVLESGAWYKFSLVATNYFGNTSAPAYATVTVSGLPIPSVNLQGGPVISIKKSDLMMTVSASISTCISGGALNNRLMFAWKQTSGPSLPILTSSVIRSSSFLIPARDLQGGEEYGVSVDVWVEGDTSLNTTATGRIVVAPSSLLALIAGGDRKIQPYAAVQLDGRLSMDPDTGDNVGLAYTWSCKESGAGACFGLSDTSPGSVSLPSTSTIDLPASWILPNKTNVITMKITKGNRTAEATLRLETGAYNPDPTYKVPEVSVSTLKPESSSQRSKIVRVVRVGGGVDRSALVVNAESGYNLVFHASAMYPNSTTQFQSQYKWEISSLSIGEPLRSLRAAELGSSDTQSDLVLQSWSLVPGTIYVLRAWAWDSTAPSTSAARSDAGWSEVVLSVNDPPSPGTCRVSPSVGSPMHTPFSIQCEGWDDSEDDKPLLYSFSRVKYTSSGDKYSELLGMPSTSSYIEKIYLPSPPSGKDKVTLSVRVSDRHGMATSMNLEVSVMANATMLEGTTSAVNATVCSGSTAIAQESMNSGNTFTAVTAADVCGQEIVDRCLNGVGKNKCDKQDVHSKISSMMDKLSAALRNREHARTPSGDLQVCSALVSLTSGGSIDWSLTDKSAKFVYRMINDSFTVGLDQASHSSSVMLHTLSNVVSHSLNSSASASASSSSSSSSSSLSLSTLIEDSVRLLLESSMRGHVAGQKPFSVDSPKISLWSQRNIVDLLQQTFVALAHNASVRMPGNLGNVTSTGTSTSINSVLDVNAVVWSPPASAHNKSSISSHDSFVVTVNVTRPAPSASISGGQSQIVSVDGASGPPVAVTVPLKNAPVTFHDNILQRVPIVRGSNELNTFTSLLSLGSAKQLQTWLNTQATPCSALGITVPTCQTYVNNTDWNPSGCYVGGLYTSSTSTSTSTSVKEVESVICACEHLSDFAVLMAISEPTGPCPVPGKLPAIIKAIMDASAMLYAFAAVYMLMFVASIVQIVRIVVRIKRERTPMPTQSWIHSFVATITLLRSIYLFIGAATAWIGLAFSLQLLLVLLPLTFEIGSYALVMFVLMGFGSKRSSVGSMRANSMSRGFLSFLGSFQGPFMILAGLLVFCDIVLVIAAGAVTAAEGRDAIALTGAILGILASISITVGFGLSVPRLIKQLSKFADVSEANRQRIRGLSQRGFGFSFGLIASSIITIVNLTTTLLDDYYVRNFAMLYGIYLAIDLIVVAFLLWFHHKFPKSQREKAMESARTSSQSQKGDSSGPSVSISGPISSSGKPLPPYAQPANTGRYHGSEALEMSPMQGMGRGGPMSARL